MRSSFVLGIFVLSCTACFVDVPELDTPGAFACADNGDCAEGYHCDSGRCVPGSMGPCADHAECNGELSFCDQGECVDPCQRGPCNSGLLCIRDDGVAGGRRCESGGCANDADCSGPTPRCEGGACVECRANADCASGETCAASHTCVTSTCTNVRARAGGTECVPSCTVGAACTAGSSAGSCVRVLDSNGNYQPVCIAPSTACADGNWLVYGEQFDYVDDARGSARCTCAMRPTASSDGWYTLGTSACNDGLSGAVAPGGVNDSSPPSLAMGDDGTVAVAFTAANPEKAWVRQWSPTDGWIDPPGCPGSPSGSSRQPSVAVGSASGTGMVRVAWVDSDANYTYPRTLQARCEGGWRGEQVSATTWSDTGSGLSYGGAGVSDPALAWDGSSALMAVWIGSNGTANGVMASHVSGGQWSAFELVTPGMGPRLAPRFGDFLLAWRDPNNYVNAKLWNGTSGAWQYIGTTTMVDTSAPATSDADIASNSSGVSFVVWSASNGVQIRMSSGGSWTSLSSGIQRVALLGANPTVATLPQPVVAYESDLGRIHVKSFDPGSSSFGGLGGSDMNDGIGEPNQQALRPRIVVGKSPRRPAQDAICVAWYAPYGSSNHVYLRCHDL